MLLDPDVGDDRLRARLVFIAPEEQLREDQSDLATLDAGRPEGPASSRRAASARRRRSRSSAATA